MVADQGTHARISRHRAVTANPASPILQRHRPVPAATETVATPAFDRTFIRVPTHTAGGVLRREPESGAPAAKAEPGKIRIRHVVRGKGRPHTGKETFEWLVSHIPAGYHLNPDVNARNFRNYYVPGPGPDGEDGIWVIVERNLPGRGDGGPGSGGRDTDAAAQPSAAAGQDYAAPGPRSEDAPSRTSGQGAVTTWDSAHRGKYVTENKARSAKAVEAIEQAGRENSPGKAMEIAKQASEDRAAARTTFQEKVSPGARDLSKAIDTGQDFAASVEKYSKRLPSVEGGAAVPAESEAELARRIAVGAGETRASIKALAKVGRIAGPIMIAVGIGLGIRAVVNAPPGQRGRVAAREVGAFVGGMIGLSVGTSAGVAAAGFFAALVVALGFSNPIGWLAIGLGLVVGGLVGWWFSKRGGQVGEAIYDAADGSEDG